MPDRITVDMLRNAEALTRTMVAEGIATAIRAHCRSEGHSVSLTSGGIVCDRCEEAAEVARQHANTPAEEEHRA